MTEPSTAQASQPPPPATEPGSGPAPETVWQRLQHHTVLQWTLAYAAAAYTVLHATQMVVESFDWPHLIVRVVALGLVVVLPVVVLLAWYHGHKAQHRFSTAELSILTVLLLIAGTVMWGFTRGRAPTERAVSVSTAPAAITTQTASPVPAASVAVVPFTNLTGEAGKEYFSDGMAEELINELTKVPGLKVPARTSSFAYKGRNIDIRQIARDLGVATILEGSVRSAGERIRVTAQLINAQTGYHIWSNTYDGNFGDVFKVQDDISAQIVEALKTSMNVQLPALSTRPAPTSDPEAYRLYLQAKAAGASGSFDVALRLATQATMRDTTFARAWAYKAILSATSPVFHTVTGNVMAEAEHSANQALALDPSLIEAQTALGVINARRGDWIAAETSFQRAVGLAPNDSTPRVNRSIVLWSPAGHVRQALKEMQEAYALAPAATATISTLASIYSLRAQNSEALKYAELAAELGGSGTNMIEVARQQVAVRSGQCGEAANLILPALPAALRSPDGISTVRQVFAAMCAPTGRESAARALTALLRNVKPNALAVQPRMEIVVWYAMLGDLDAAFEFGNRSLDELARSGNVVLTWPVLWLPEMRSFRKDPRFQQFVSRLRLFDYWKQYGPPDECDLRGDTLVCR